MSIKKLIAREIIILFSTLLVCGILALSHDFLLMQKRQQIDNAWKRYNELAKEKEEIEFDTIQNPLTIEGMRRRESIDKELSIVIADRTSSEKELESQDKSRIPVIIIIICITVYPFRGIYYILKWAIATLRT